MTRRTQSAMNGLLCRLVGTGCLGIMAISIAWWRYDDIISWPETIAVGVAGLILVGLSERLDPLLTRKINR